MSRGYPSMTALLGLLAIAGYQNRDKLAETLSGLGKGGSAAGSQGGIGGILSQITGSTGGASAGGFLSGGLSELVDRFRQHASVHEDRHPRRQFSERRVAGERLVEPNAGRLAAGSHAVAFARTQTRRHC